MTVDPLSLPWRTGRKVGRTIYAQHGPEPSDTDELIGVMDTPVLAAEAVRWHNAAQQIPQDIRREVPSVMECRDS